ncbi:hypothetical protein P378_10540 [Desulforamulus profundi]|uniref:Uncharacterized protein n=1 Tax=Desulforamulus profundi TaxID=1383067 RepID=A0A2C6L2H9_9FIRM|nr:hypothetical protein [Desulforamulus profundi]PHJ38261.1 hypothetical protein P378_10540 [Desulforamulus profundi]
MPVVEFNNRHQKEKEVRTGNMQDKRLLLKAAFLSQVVILLTGLAALWFFYVRQGTVGKAFSDWTMQAWCWAAVRCWQRAW